SGTPSRPWVRAGGCAAGSTSASAKRPAVASYGMRALRRLSRRGGDDALGPARLGRKRRPRGHFVVPFDQGRRRPASPNRLGEEGPDGFPDRGIVGVNQKREPSVVSFLGIAREVDLADRAERETGEITEGVEAVIGRADEDIVDVEQKAAASPADDFGKKI